MFVYVFVKRIEGTPVNLTYKLVNSKLLENKLLIVKMSWVS